MFQTLPNTLPCLQNLRNNISSLYYEGNIELLHRQKISIVGSRRPNFYTKALTQKIASKLASRGVVIISGAAMGVDALAHQGAEEKNTIAVFANGIDITYPKTNQKLIDSIRKNGLVLSQFEPGFRATKWSFVVRNEIVVALGEILIVTQAEQDSGTLRSVELALEMGKEVYTIPHRLGESKGSNELLEKGYAKPIYNIDSFVTQYGCEIKKLSTKEHDDPFLAYCATHPSYNEATQKWGQKVFEYELRGEIYCLNGKIHLSDKNS